MRRGKRVLTIVSVIIFIGALAFVAWQVLKVRKINTLGCELMSEESIVLLSGLEYGQSIFSVDTQEVMEKLDTDPYIKPESVEIIYPDCVEITIKERKEAACIEKGDTLLIIDEECCLLRIIEDGQVPYTRVYGLNVDKLIVGERLGTSDTFKMDVLSRVLTAAGQSEVAALSIDVTLTADVIMEIDGGFTVELGDDTELGTKFSLIESSVKQLAETGKTGGIIDVASASAVYYREK